MATAINHGSDNDRNLIAQVTYDKGGRVSALRDPRGKQTTYIHDQLDRRTGITTPLSKTWTTAYADLGGGGTRTTVTDPKSVATQRDFDRVGRLASIGYGNPANTPDVSFSYNLAGMPTAMTEEDDSDTIRETTYTYDGLRRVTAVGFDTDGDGNVDETVAYEYDAGGLRTKMALPGDLDIIYEYDANGQLVGMTDWDAQETTFAYDLAGRHVATERPGGFRSRYRFDVLGRLRTLHHAVGKRVLGHFEYDLDGRGDRISALEVLPHPATVSDTTIPHDSDALVYTGSWSDVGGFHETTDRDARLKLLFFGRQDITLSLGEGPDHGIIDIYINKTLWTSIDAYAASAGQRDIVLSLEHEGPHRLVIRNRRERNSASTGNKLRFKQLVIEDIAYDARTIEYAYDTVARLLEARVNPGENTAAADGDLLRREQYTFDLAGNRLSASLALNGGAPTVTSYTYNDGNQLTSDGTNTHTYDDNGNLTSDGVSSYAWDRANRLTSVGATSYAYDGAGRRIQKTVSATDTDYLLDIQRGLTQVLAETTGGNTTHFLHSPKGIHSRRDSSGDWHWSVQDGLGSVRGEVNVDVLVEGIRHFGAYGADYGTQGSISIPFGYTGEQTDGNDLVYLRNRYYNPTMATFTRLDPEEGQIQNPVTLNRYAYVGGNPINRTDPSGLAYGIAAYGHTNDVISIPKRSTGKAVSVSASKVLNSLKQVAKITVSKAEPVNIVLGELHQAIRSSERAAAALTQHITHQTKKQSVKQRSALNNLVKTDSKKKSESTDLQRIQESKTKQSYQNESPECGITSINEDILSTCEACCWDRWRGEHPSIAEQGLNTCINLCEVNLLPSGRCRIFFTGQRGFSGRVWEDAYPIVFSSGEKLDKAEQAIHFTRSCDEFVVVGYSAGGDSAIIFAQLTSTPIRGIALLGATLTGAIGTRHDVSITWRRTISNLLASGTYIYALNDLSYRVALEENPPRDLDMMWREFQHPLLHYSFEPARIHYDGSNISATNNDPTLVSAVNAWINQR